MPPHLVEEPVGSAGWQEMVAFRLRILRAPLGLAFTEAERRAEAEQIHLALRLENRLAGTALLVPPEPDGTAKLRQMAIDPALRGRGLGRLVVGHAEDRLRACAASRVALSARATAVGFYERLGYATEGEAYIEVTIAHRRMSKSLAAIIVA